jgi:hypothetical protein
MKRWQFGQTLDRRWYWRKFNDYGTHIDSPRMFASRVDCIADAFEHGLHVSPTCSIKCVHAHTEQGA